MQTNTWGRRGWMAFGTLLLLSCGAGGPDEILPEITLEDAAAMGELSSEIHAELPLYGVQDLHGIGQRGDSPTRVVLASASAYLSYFGHPAPSTVHFDKGDAVIFYSAGFLPSSGYDARVLRAAKSKSGQTLFITTQLSAPGPDCHAMKMFTKPYTLVKVRIPRHTQYVRWDTSDIVESCSTEMNPCAYTLCAAGTVCVQDDVDPAQAQCVPADEAPPGQGKTGTTCGSTTCGSGEFCCNASCGICAPVGGGCIKMFCGK